MPFTYELTALIRTLASQSIQMHLLAAHITAIHSSAGSRDVKQRQMRGTKKLLDLKTLPSQQHYLTFLHITLLRRYFHHYRGLWSISKGSLSKKAFALAGKLCLWAQPKNIAINLTPQHFDLNGTFAEQHEERSILSRQHSTHAKS